MLFQPHITLACLSLWLTMAAVLVSAAPTAKDESVQEQQLPANQKLEENKELQHEIQELKEDIELILQNQELQNQEQTKQEESQEFGEMGSTTTYWEGYVYVDFVFWKGELETTTTPRLPDSGKDDGDDEK